MKFVKDNDITINARIDEIANCLINGKKTAEIHAIGKALKWNVTVRQIDNYIKQAKERIGSAVSDKSFELNLTLQRFEDLYTRCLENEDIKSAITILEKKSKLLGLEVPIENINPAELSKFEIKFTTLTVDDEKELKEYRELKAQNKLQLAS